MKPVRPDSTHPAMNARVRNMPGLPNVRPETRLGDSSGLNTSVDVTNTTIASGIRMTAIVLNWRRRYAIAPSWMAAAISIIFGVPWSASRTPCIR